MMPAIAEISYDSKDVGIWLAILFFLVAGAKNVLSITDRFKVKKDAVPQPLMVQAVPQLVTHEEFGDFKSVVSKQIDDLERRLGSLRSEIHRNHLEVLNKGEERADKIHTRINALIDAVNAQRSKS